MRVNNMRKKVVIMIVSVLVLLGAFAAFLYFTSEDVKTSLNITEKKWIDNNKKVLQDISLYSDVPVFSFNSDGVIFDFLKNVEGTTGLEFNKISYIIGKDVKTDYSFQEKDKIEDKDILMYQDNYVLVSKNKIYTSPTEMKGISVGVLENTIDLVNNYLLGADVTFKAFQDYNAMFSSIGKDVDAIVVPKIQTLSLILNKGLNISYNINEYKTYFVLHLGGNDTLNSILTKQYKKWSSENFTKSFNNNLLSSYFSSSLDSSKNIAKLRSKRYVYGFVKNAPYDLIKDGNLIGINDEVIKNFAHVTDVTVEYKEYNSYDALKNAFNKNEIDFFFNIYKEDTYEVANAKTLSPFSESMIILTRDNSDIIVNSVNSLKEYKVGVLKGSLVAAYLSNYNIELQEFDNMKSLMNNTKLDVKAIDNYNYDHFIVTGIKKYSMAYEVKLNSEYNYMFRNTTDNSDFANLFNFYLTFAKTRLIINDGMLATASNSSVTLLIKYLVSVLVIILCVFIGILTFKQIKNSKKHKTVLSKEDKLKYIDMLTSLKNRNYLNDNIEKWDEREVYPQAIIIVDLNNVAYINDNYGHAEGDLVIKEAANILIKTQNPNSEIIRTNGNEFLIYLVSYDEKQVITYIKKLSKELKDVAHGFGAAIGYSMINDAIKTIDDAINEATIDMRNNKEELSKD